MANTPRALLALVLLAGCKGKDTPPAPPPAPPVTPAAATPPAPPPPPPAPPPPEDKRQKLEATREGTGGLSTKQALPLAELKKKHAAPEYQVEPNLMKEKRGASTGWISLTSSDGATANIFFASPAKPFLWFELADFDGTLATCVEDVCQGDPIEAAKKLAGDTCTANHDGQGFSMTFACGDPRSFVVLAALPEAVRQEHPLGQEKAPIAIDKLAEAKATVKGFAWVVPGATWAPSSHDEDDR
jgi:hypothetical protein